MASMTSKIKCHECFGHGYIVIPDEVYTEVGTKYGEHTIPDDWSKINHVYIWFQALKTEMGWSGIPGYVYETPSGEYYAPCRGELIKVTKDTRDEFRESNDI